MLPDYVDKIDLEKLADVVQHNVDYTEIHKLGWNAMQMRLAGYTTDGTLLQVVAYYDAEKQKVVCRHE